MSGLTSGKNSFLSGNQALARGAIEAGIGFASSYPGTPATGIHEYILSNSLEFNIHAHWSVNEKVALESAIGASLAGTRSLVSMKNVGLNVAADPFFSLSYTGVNAGLVIAVSDDPGSLSSQSEQDSRHFAAAAGIPCLEPSSPEEAREMALEAFDLSERFDLPVMVRLTSALSFSKSQVPLGSINRTQKDISIPLEKYVMLPSHAIKRRKLLLEKQHALLDYSEKSSFNSLSKKTRDSIISSGMAFSNTVQALSDLGLSEQFSVLKLGVTNPLPDSLITELINSSNKTLVIEELDPIIESRARMFGRVHGKDFLPLFGALSPDSILRGISDCFGLGLSIPSASEPVPAAPLLCPGCPHRALFFSLNKLTNVLVTGDVGCYTLGALPPLSAIKTQLCMGSSIAEASGLFHSGVKEHPMAVIGDSTFLHSGIPALIDAVYSNSRITVIILDNDSTAMTGFQPTPASGKDHSGALDLGDLCLACGAKSVILVDPYDTEFSFNALEHSLYADGVSVVISRRACSLKSDPQPSYLISPSCDSCGSCLRLACPAIHPDPFKIDSSCTGCGLCAKACPRGAIIR